MKRNRSKRILATILCMVMVLTSNISALAEGEVLQQNAVETGTEGLEATPATVSEAPEEPAPEQPQEPASETPQGSVPEQPTSGTPEQPAPETQSGTPEQPTPGTQSETPEQPTPGTQSETPEQSTPGTQPGTPEQPTSGTSSETTPQTESKDPSETPKGETPEGEKTEEETPEEEKPEEPVFSEATELHQDFKDASGKLIQRIKAKLPAGAFEAETSQITMEVSYVDSDMEKYVAGMMEEKLPEGNVLGDYMLYKIEFKVNGEVRDSLEPITIIFEKSGLEITDTKKANVFYFNPKNEEEGRAKDELVEITQRNEMLEYLQSSGQSTADIEDYDLSSIEMKEENLSGKITLEGRTSTIYGCYVEKEEKPEENKEETPEEKPEALELTFEDEQIEVKVSAEEVGIIPEGATLKVVPITAENETKEQYEEVAKQIQEKVAEEEKEVAGFLAYDISFVDEDGKEVEPNGKVKVSMNYKKAELPKEVKENKATDAEVTVLHLEENENGEVKEVVDMAAEQKATVDTLATTEGAKVQSVEVETEGFSVFTITWKYNNYNKLVVNLHYGCIDDNGKWIEFDDEIQKQPQGIENFKKENETRDLKEYVVELSDLGYTNSKITVDSPYGEEIQILRSFKEGRKYNYTYGIKYDSNDREWISSKDGKEEGHIYYVYTKNSSSEGGGGNTGGSSVLGTPDHNKYIEQRNINDYTLSLDITGKVGEALPIDILLIVDKSASMDDTRRKNVNSAITTLKTELQNAEVDINMAAVTFSSAGNGTSQTRSDDSSYDEEDSKSDARIENNWTPIQEFDFSLKKSEGGTNWQAGVRKGKEILAERSEKRSRKYVLFLTDGEPTYRYYQTSNTITQGTGKSDPNDYNFIYAQNEWLASSHLTASQAYVIDATDKGSTVCKEFATAIGGQHLLASNKDAMETAFSKIAQDILKPVYKNVTIEDELSAYADFAKDPNFVVTSTKDGRDKTLIEGKDYSLKKVGKKVTLQLLNGKALADDITYTLSFNITPTEEAKAAFVENGGYLHTGDEGTDAPNNDTSSNKPGFHSNESAKVFYQENDQPQTSADYKHPVIQIDTGTIDIPETPNPIDGSITKTMGKPIDGKYPITLEVKTRLEETTVEEESEADVILVIDTSGSMNESDGTTTRLGATKDAIYSFVDNFVGLEGTTNSKHRVGIVTFGGSASIKNYGSDEYFSGDSTEIRDIVKKIGASGGTNTDAGLTKAFELAQKSDRDKYVILLTDGVPTYHYDENWGNLQGGGNWSQVEDFNGAVDSALKLKKIVKDIYTIGVLNGYSSEDNATELDVARTLLASSNSEHQHSNYSKTYKLLKSWEEYDWFDAVWKYEWNTTQEYTYSSGYFEVKSGDDTSTVLKDIWEQLATIINNQTSGSTGDGWQVTDTMAAYTNFLELEGMEINGYELHLSKDRKKLTTEISNENGIPEKVTVASYDDNTKTITWTLNDKLADKSIKYNHGIDYTYRLTYYVDFEDTGKTEFRNTNETTYVTVTPEKKIYPPKMPFFVNLVGNKVDSETAKALQGANFEVYSDAETKNLIGMAEADENGHFAFQFGQTDFELTSSEPENYQKVVYLKETNAPVGYELDTETHKITLNISNVVYTNKGVANGTVAVRVDEAKDSLVSVDNISGKIVLKYQNKPLSDWGIVKRSSSNKDLILPGAEFALYKKNNNGHTNYMPDYKATSDENGIITTWKNVETQEEIPSREIPSGVYVLKETKAPTGYAVSPIQWEITIASNGEVTIKTGGQEVESIDKTELDEIQGADKNGTYFYYENTPVYSLPSTGGSGIFVYMISGTLLLIAAALFLYKMKREEVLKR